MSQNRITLGIKIPMGKAPSPSTTPIKIQKYSYFPSDEVGLGYISHVYLGRNDLSNEMVAIKVMDVSKEDELGQQLIQEELNILHHIKGHHPQHLLLLHEHLRLKNHLYIVTEYCEGKDIAKALRKKKILSEGEAQSIMKQLMKAFKELYEMRIIHRDLKLSNILVQNGRLKLADFGFSIQQEKYEQQGSSYNVGSPYYMPPETLKFNKYSFKSDIWALGVMAFEMVYGRLPWKERVESLLYDKIMKTNIEELFDGSIAVSQYYKTFIRSCLQLQVQKRGTPQSLISYSWPLALDFIEGLASEPNSRPMSMLQQLAGLTTRKVATQHCILDVSNRSNHNSFTKIQPLREKSPNFLNREVQPQKNWMGSTGNLKDLNEKSFSALQQKQFDAISKIIVSQLNYCRFIKQTEEILGNGCSYESNNLRKHLNGIYLGKLKQLSKLEKGIQCAFSQLPSLREYRLTPNWQKIREIIVAFTERVPNANSFDTSYDFALNEQAIAQAIASLKSDLSRNYISLQQLTYLYQLKLLQNHNNLTLFALNSKLQLLVNRLPQPLPESEKQALCSRLSSKLALLDF